VGRDYGLAEGQHAARLCALNLLAHLMAALDGDLDRVVRTVRLAGYVNSTPDFLGQSQVMNGASDLFVELLGEAGRHARMAVGVGALPTTWRWRSRASSRFGERRAAPHLDQPD
jgi:enamine deaminase RidA (YjgF/YER057c/UK114 family)